MNIEIAIVIFAYRTQKRKTESGKAAAYRSDRYEIRKWMLPEVFGYYILTKHGRRVFRGQSTTTSWPSPARLRHTLEKVQQFDLWRFECPVAVLAK